MTGSKARKLLGKYGNNLSDDELKKLIKKVNYLASVVYEDIEKNGVPLSFRQQKVPS